MSYNYDLNPWDDNYNANTSQNSAQQQTGAYNAPSSGGGGYTAGGYNDPVTTGGYGASPGFDQQGQHQDDYPQQQQQAESDQFIDDGQQQQEATKPPESGCKRFLRAHIPLCGPFLDITSAIHIPFLDILLKFVNRDLLVSKVFYFFFYSAFGSLFPLMGVYFKQLGMNPAQVGILTGVRPFIEIFSAPFWNSLAERFQKAKALLLFSLFCWIVFTHSLAHIRPPASACVAFNDTDYVLYVPYSDNDLSNYEIVGQTGQEKGTELEGGKSGENEKFISRMPGEKETEILASEENQNVQGRRKRRRRRRKRQASLDEYTGEQRTVPPVPLPSPPLLRPSAGRERYTYSVDGVENSDDDGGYESHLDLNIDLENDFDDTLIGGSRRFSRDDDQTHNGDDGGYQIGDSFDDVAEDTSASMRYKRNAVSEDYSSGEPQDEDPPERPSNMDEEEWNRYNGGGAGRQNEMNNGEGEGGEAADESAEENGEGTDYDSSSNNNGYAKNKKVSSKHNHQKLKGSAPPSSTTTSTTTPGSTINERKEGESANQPPRDRKEDDDDDTTPASSNRTKKIYKQRHKTPPTHIVGMSPITVEYAVNYNKDKHSQFVTPMFSTIVYKLDDIKEVFFLLLLLISLGEFFSAPAITIADSITLGYLGENTDLYGRQRMFGSFGWAITLLLVGMALDNSTTIADHPCGPHQRERSYTVCFAIFSLLMACAFFTATQFKFNYQNKAGSKSGDTNGGAGAGGQALVTRTTDNNNVVTTTLDGQAVSSNVDDLYGSTQPRNIFNTAPPVNAPPPGKNQKEKFEFLDKWKSAVFASRTRNLPEWVNVFRQFKDPLNLTYLFITWFLGCGVGLVFTFLFWHLQDVGGTPTLFGICSVINHISEILAYFFSSNFIKRFGHTKVLSVGLGCNVIRFIYVAFLSNPYYALPFELVQGITHAACFAACCSYISHVSKPELRTSTQGVMQGLHHGIGRACGTLLGGYMINAIGSRASFCIYGLLSGCVLAGFLYVRKRASMVKDEEVKIDDNEAFGGFGAPQGVPTTIPGKMTQSVPQQDIDYQW